MGAPIKTSEWVQMALDGTQIRQRSTMFHKSIDFYSIWETGIMSNAAFYYE